MQNLLIIDVQNTYASYVKTLIEEIPQYATNFQNIIYLYDNHSGNSEYDEVPYEWLIDEDDNESNSFYNNFSSTISKQYGFFRDLMDSKTLSLNDEDIIMLGKFMLRNNICDAREILEDSETQELFRKDFINSPCLNIDFDNHFFSLPLDLVEELKIYHSYTLVGGGINECLKEIALLLDICEIEYVINYEYCY